MACNQRVVHFHYLEKTLWLRNLIHDKIKGLEITEQNAYEVTCSNSYTDCEVLSSKTYVFFILYPHYLAWS